jgi:zinc transport system ATP-binding protein
MGVNVVDFKKGPPGDALIECRNLSYRYDGSLVCAVNDVSFTIDAGDFFCVVGENGSGKSTLVSMLTGLIKPSDGEIRYRGLKRHEVGYLPQQTPVQKDFPASVMEVVMTGLLNKKRFVPFFNKRDMKVAAENLDRLGALDLERRSYRELSGGQQQRVLLARALCASETLLVLDEPTTGLDPFAQTEMYKLIRRLNETGMTIFMISHDVSSAVRMANKILHMDGGAIFLGTVEDYLQSAPGKMFLGRRTKGENRHA